ncbi:MAG: hypothetical protein QNJ90_09415 [Planctomycetota bacterium]|nr:hypothetical protein [Planctomycetota bacterium]
MTRIIRLSRRDVLFAAGATAALSLAGCGGGGGDPVAQQTGPQIVYKLSGRGRRISNAAKSHNANKLFVSQAAADANRAHPGDRSRIVELPVSPARWEQLFGGGFQIADLRHV